MRLAEGETDLVTRTVYFVGLHVVVDRGFTDRKRGLGGLETGKKKVPSEGA